MTITQTGRADTQYRVTVREMPSDDRPRERLLNLGAGTLKTEELLAIILRVGTQGENVIELSARLLREHGGLGGLLTADMALLAATRGMGEAKTAQLKAALEMGRRLSVLTQNARAQITSPQDVANLLMIEMGYLAQEQLRVVCLDTKNYVVAQQVVYQGTVNSSVVRVAEVFKPAISRTCPAIVVAHNHPSGDPAPSPEDVRTTEQLRKAGELLDIELLDHIVIGHNCFVSMKERRLGF
jgi:DNA repair protein RadC